MNRILRVVILIALVSSMLLAAQIPSDKVPIIVRQSCEAKFPGVKKIEWKLKSDQNYEAEFKLNGVEVAAKFKSNGKWLETETTIARAKLPADVRATISKKFGGY